MVGGQVIGSEKSLNVAEDSPKDGWAVVAHTDADHNLFPRRNLITQTVSSQRVFVNAIPYPFNTFFLLVGWGSVGAIRTTRHDHDIVLP